MKKILLALYVCVMLGMLPACTTLQSFSFDRLQAADVSFPTQVKNVGIVNCMPQVSQDTETVDYASGVFEGDGKVATEMLATGIAETGYFEQVVICDEPLGPEGVEAMEGFSISGEKADSLMEVLGVDLLFAMERVQIQLKESSLFLPEVMMEVPVLDGVITPLVKVYVPKRNTPLYMVSKTDTICWELSPELTYGQIIKESSEYGAKIPVTNLLPHWKEQHRYYFDGRNADMRDAGVYVREQNWDSAAELWQRLHDTRKGKTRMCAAYNLAVYYEMQDDFERAKEYLDTAASLAKEGSWEAQLIQFYQFQLGEQSKQSQRLKLQMQRFGS